MALRRHRLNHRIYGQAGNHSMAMSGAHPAGGPDTPFHMPVAVVTVYPAASGYVTLGMEELAPVITADGAMIPATMPGRWDQLAQAGGARNG
jgi:hypothetical protein